MSTGWDWPGSRWWRVDLHTHSPASYDFRPATDRDAKDWAAWVQAAKDAGLHAVALTDHNTPDGIDHVQAAARAGGGITIFPGVEVTVGGIHLLCILDPARGRDDVVALLTKLGIDPRSFGEQTTASTKGIVDAIAIADEHGAIVVAAHVNGPNGLVMLEGADRLRALQSERLAGVELAPLPSGPHQAEDWRDPASLEVQGWLDGSKAGRRITSVRCSDAHSRASLGRHYSWFKMARPDAEGLRLALFDGEASVRDDASDDPNRHASAVIESITIKDAKYVGRSSALTVGLNPWLNAIIGGRGTGKSTVVDMLRRTLDRDEELPGSTKPPDNRDETLRDAFDRRMRVSTGRASDGLLLATTTVDVNYRKDGERFRLRWTQAGGATSIARVTSDGEAVEDGNVRERFPVRIYSQKQLFELANDANALLTVIDDVDAVRGGELARARREGETRYLSLCAEARALRAQSAELADRRAILTDVRRKLDILQQGAHAAALSAFRNRKAQDDAWSAVQDATKQRVDALSEVLDGLSVPELRLTEVTPADDPPLAALRRAHDHLRSAIEGARASVGVALADMRAAIEKSQQSEDAQQWRSEVVARTEAYSKVTDDLASAGIAHPDEYGDLVQRVAGLEREIAELEKKQDAAARLESEAARALQDYRELRAEHARRRSAFAAWASNANVEIEIRPNTVHEQFEEFLRDVLAVRGFDDAIATLCRRVRPPIGESVWEFGELDRLVAELRAFSQGVQDHGPIRDRRFDNILRKVPPERLDRLALYLPDDAVDVSFAEAQGGPWKKLTHGSPGQQTAALLAFVLGYGTEPIVLDQPEDDLDNSVIYQLLVQRLRDVKPGRQIIVVTHNANIVVHGDAELVCSLEARSGQTRIAFSGGLQEQGARDEVCRVMEGGREAFERRYRRIVSSRRTS